MRKREIVNFFMSWSAGDLTRDKCKIRGGNKTRKLDQQASDMVFYNISSRLSFPNPNTLYYRTNAV